MMKIKGGEPEVKNRLLQMFQKTGKNKQLNAIIQKIEMNASNNYKDAAQDGLRELEEVLKELEAAGTVSGKQKEYYEERLAVFQKQMEKFTHKDQIATWT